VAAVRTLVVWCPDWPVTAAIRDTGDELPEHLPIAVLDAGTVYACSELARAEGVRRGQRRRDAQAACPELVVVPYDPVRDVRVFEPVVDAVDTVAAGVEVLRPGTCATPARGPAGHVGGEAAAAELIVDRIAESCAVEAQVGVADGVFGAVLAARAGVLVEPGRTPEFLAGLDVRVLGRPELTGLLRRLGIRTVGAFAALPAGDVLARFGFDAALAHRLAGGRDERLLAPRATPPDLTVSQGYDPPIERVDTAAFTARALAEELHELLGRYATGCTRLTITAVTGHAEELTRTWRHDGILGPGDVADRVRWQLEGWLTGTHRPTAGIATLRLVPEGLVAHAGFQRRLWGDTGEDADRAHRSLTRVQGLLGPEQVFTGVPGGGRTVADRVRAVPWGDERIPALPVEPPWPGHLPVPVPIPVAATAFVPAEVRAADGSVVGVTGRHQITAPPATVTTGGAAGARSAAGPVEVVAWGGPWPVEERWWAPGESRRLARIQVVLADGRTLLLVVESGRWRVAATYD
jgi:protein ImuB